MSENNYPKREAIRRLHRNSTVLEGVSVGSIVLLAAAAAAGAGVGVHAHDTKRINHLSYESGAKTESLAASQAAAFTAALYDSAQYPEGVPMPVLNGEMHTTIKTADGAKHEGVYKDPILLATDDIDAKPDLKGDFLKGGWIGIQGNDENGKAVIHAVRYGSDKQTTEEFVPYTSSPTDIVFSDLGVYATAVKGGPGLQIDELIGFDQTGETALHNGDGSLIRPGLSIGMK